MQLLSMSDVGSFVRSERVRQGMTQADLAERLHTGRDWVVRLEQGNPRLEAQRVLNALAVLNVSLIATPPTDKGAGPGDDDPFASVFEGLT